MIETLLPLLFGLVALYFVVWVLILLPARMATSRGRSALVWVLVSLLFSPVLACLLLLLLGGGPQRARERASGRS